MSTAKSNSKQDAQMQFLLTAVLLELLGFEVGIQGLALAELSYKGLAVAISTKLASLALFIFLGRNVMEVSGEGTSALIGWRMFCAYGLIVLSTIWFVLQLANWFN